MASASIGRSGRRVQYAALPYRVRRDGTVEVRLITSRETRRWVIPKGWPMKGLAPAKAAARETYEEAGLLGAVSRKPIGLYTYDKRLANRSVPCDVIVFPLKVKHQVRNWPERSQRFGFWFSIESAAAAVQEEDLKELILAFGDLMAKKWEAKRKTAPAGLGEAASDALPEDMGAKPPEAGTAASKKAEAKKAEVKKADARKAGAKKAEARSSEVAPVEVETETPAPAKAARAKAKPAKVKAKLLKQSPATPGQGEMDVEPVAADAQAAEGGPDPVPTAPAETSRANGKGGKAKPSSKDADKKDADKKGAGKKAEALAKPDVSDLPAAARRASGKSASKRSSEKAPPA